MADWYPGAHRVDVGGNGNSISARPCENILHIAASSWNVGDNGRSPTDGGAGIAGWVASEHSANGYVDQFGNMQQYCSVFAAVNGTKDGNWRNRTWESWNPEGLNGTEDQYNSSRWTAEQCERFSDLLAWDHIENNAQLTNMHNSLPSSHGVGGHRYGIAPWRVGGGEIWTLHDGKTCPGTARMTQLDAIIARASVISMAVRNGTCHLLPPGRVNLPAALARTSGTPTETDPDMSAAELNELKVLIANGFAAQAQALHDATTVTSTVNGKQYPLKSMVQYIDWNLTQDGDFDRAMAGQFNTKVPVRLPFKPPVVTPPAPPVAYTVVKGDSFDAIAAKLKTTPDKLAAANPSIKDRNALEIGQVLNIPKA